MKPLLPAYMKMYDIPLMISASTMFFLSTGRCLWSIYHGAWGFMPVTTMFLRDGVLWFLGVFAVLLAQTAINVNHPQLGNGLLLPSLVFYCVAASRITLNMKSIVVNPNGEHSNATALSELNFGNPRQQSTRESEV